MPAGSFSAEDWLDDDGVTDDARRIAVRLRFDPQAASVDVDFAGSSAQVAGSVNAVRAITLSACFYMLRCLLGEDAPATAGILRPLTLHTPVGSIVDALPPAAVAGGNVETSQRIVDVLLRALCAGGSGARAGGQRRHHEQFDHWRHRSADRRAFHLLRDRGRRHGRSPGDRWSLRRADAHDQFFEHAH